MCLIMCVCFFFTLKNLDVNNKLNWNNVASKDPCLAQIALWWSARAVFAGSRLSPLISLPFLVRSAETPVCNTKVVELLHYHLKSAPVLVRSAYTGFTTVTTLWLLVAQTTREPFMRSYLRRKSFRNHLEPSNSLDLKHWWLSFHLTSFYSPSPKCCVQAKPK